MRYFTTEQFSENLQTTPEGYLLCLGVPIARTGELIYKASELGLEGDDPVTVIRTEEELFSDATIASFQGKPVTIGHPSKFLDVENSENFRVGHLQNVRRGEGENANKLLADLLLTDLNAISLVVDAGVREVSCGYNEATVVFEGKESKAILGNHVAILQRGRAGPECAIMDAANEEVLEIKEVKKMPGKTKLKMSDKIMNIFKKSFDEAMEKEEIAEEIMDAEDPMGPVEKRLAALESAVVTLTDAINKLVAGKEKTDSEAETKEEEKTDSEAEMTEEEKADGCGTFKADQETVSRIEVLAPGFKIDGFKSEKDLKIAVLQKAKMPNGQSILDVLEIGKMDAETDLNYVNTLFSAGVSMIKNSRSALLNRRADSAPANNSALPKTPSELNQLNADFWKGREG